MLRYNGGKILDPTKRPIIQFVPNSVKSSKYKMQSVLWSSHYAKFLNARVISKLGYYAVAYILWIALNDQTHQHIYLRMTLHVHAAFLLIITYNADFLRVRDYPYKVDIKYAKQIHSLNLCSIGPWENKKHFHIESGLQLNVQKRNINKSSLHGDTINLDAFNFNWHRYSHLLHENISVYIEHIIIFICSLIELSNLFAYI